MKCRAIIAAALLPSLLSCNKILQQPSSPVAQRESVEKHELRIDIGNLAPSTRASVIGDTSGIDNIQFYVYDISDTQPESPEYSAGPYGVLEFYTKVSGKATSVACEVTGGKKTIFALVNGKDYVPESLKKDFLQDVYSLPENGGVGKVPMFGILADYDPSADDYKVKIPVKHLFSIVKIDKITFAPTDAIMKQTTMKAPKVNAMSLVNAGCKFDLFDLFQYGKVNTEHICNAPADVFKSAGKKYPCTFETGIDAAVNQSSYVYDTPHYFFCTPTVDTETQISILVNYDGFDRVNYYNVKLGKIDLNKIYEISNLTIKGLGSDDPATILERESLELSITIQDYTVVSTEEEI